MTDALAPPVPDAIRLHRFANAFEQRLVDLPARDWDGGRAAAMADILQAADPRRGGAWRHRFCAQSEASDMIARAVRGGTLPVWTVAPHGPHLIDPWHLQEIDTQAIKTGTYKPRDETHPLHRTQLWVKRGNAELWADEMVAALYPELPKPKATARLEADCAKWLAAEFAAGSPGKRADFLVRAQEAFPGLGYNQFERAWTQQAQKFGRNKSGRPRKVKSPH